MTADIPGWDDGGLEDPHAAAVPGTRPRVQHAPKEEPKTGWDAHPRTYRVNGEDTELFPISAFIEATGFSHSTIRNWEREGILPQPAMRSPRKDSDKVPGHRLYSRAFIEGVVRIAKEEGVYEMNVRNTDFRDRVLQLFRSTGG